MLARPLRHGAHGADSGADVSVYRGHHIRQPPGHRQFRSGQTNQTADKLLHLLSCRHGRSHRHSINAILHSKFKALRSSYELIKIK